MLRHPALARLRHISVWIVGVALLVFCALQLILRYLVLPDVNNYRRDIEHALSGALHLPVTIASVGGRMQGARPRLELRGLEIKDAAGRPALSFDDVVGVVGWTSLFKLTPHFYSLDVNAPVLAIRRDNSGKIFVAGLPVKTDSDGPDISAWVLDQSTITIREAQLTWTDEMRQAPPLTLDHVNFRLEKTLLGQHRFGLMAQPPALLSSQIDVRGDFDGDSFTELQHWNGELYSSVSYADLAGWHPWVDYPVELSRGRGATRLWLEFENLRPTSMTLDVSLADVRTRLAPDLVVLPLTHLNGRLSIKRNQRRFELSTRKLSLATSDGIQVASTDMHFQRDKEGGDFSINSMDFHALASLAAHLPLPGNLRQQLKSYAPHGTLSQFEMRWRGEQWPLSHYSIKGNVEKLSIASIGNQPGISGLSGKIVGDENAGTVQLAGRESQLTLPTVFHQPLIFARLDARVGWRRDGKNTELTLTQAQFRNADADGTASGTYVIQEQGMGSIDLDARLTRAEANAVWRYMPYQAGADVGPFLHAGLSKGKVTEATLKLRGDLNKFPFADRSGIFRIHGVFHDAALSYAENWPQIDGIAGSIDFDGPKMTITARNARILGVPVGPATVILPDMETLDEQLLVEGKAAGATKDFLKFIDASPVSEQIDHFTESMSASGNGVLDLKLVLPLRRLEQSTVNGSYRFEGNQLLLDPEMPPLDEVRGSLEFSASSLGAKGIAATMFGLPLRVNLKSQTDGSVLAEASGDATAAQLRKQFSYSGLKNLAGSAHWSATVKARKSAAEIRIASDLIGMSSTLPEPFNKTAKEALPLLFERKPADVRVVSKKTRDKSNRTLTELSLGRALRAQLVSRDDGGKSTFERGLVSVGDVAARMPERGLTVAIFQPRIDVDLWRSLAAAGSEKTATVTTAATTSDSRDLMPNRIDLRTAELLAMGRSLHDVKIAASRPASIWAADINSRELAARLEWSDGENGNSDKLSGRITRFVIPEATAADIVPGDAIKSLPNLDLTLDHLALNGHDYGELRLVAENRSGDWSANFSVRNDDGALEGQGRWRLAASPPPAAAKVGAKAPSAKAKTPTPSAAPTLVSETQTEFKLHARNVERFLNRIGYPNTVKRGSADLNGRLGWNGAPQDFDIASLNGQITLDARDGQFNKLEPGVGRLLGILSLQSIPRRITLDFRDIFSEGFAFDSVKGQVAVSKGILDTQNMQIQGPAAKVQMAGTVDLNNETQNLKVRVQPKLSDSVTTGVLIANPAIGATAWVFNKVFGNPLDKAFAYDFAVTGNWVDPKVDKIGAQQGATENKELAP